MSPSLCSLRQPHFVLGGDAACLTGDLQRTMLFFSSPVFFFSPLLDTLLSFFLPSHFLYHQMKAIQTKTVQSALCVWKTEHQRQLDLPEMATAVATVALC